MVVESEVRRSQRCRDLVDVERPQNPCQLPTLPHLNSQRIDVDTLAWIMGPENRKLSRKIVLAGHLGKYLNNTDLPFFRQPFRPDFTKPIFVFFIKNADFASPRNPSKKCSSCEVNINATRLSADMLLRWGTFSMIWRLYDANVHRDDRPMSYSLPGYRRFPIFRL